MLYDIAFKGSVCIRFYNVHTETAAAYHMSIVVTAFDVGVELGTSVLIFTCMKHLHSVIIRTPQMVVSFSDFFVGKASHK